MLNLLLFYLPLAVAFFGPSRHLPAVLKPAVKLSMNSPINVCVVGSGPAGLLASYAFLERPNQRYKVHLIDSRADPRLQPYLGPRAYSLGINLRGQRVFDYFKNKSESATQMWKRIEQEGVYSDAFNLYLSGFKLPLRSQGYTRNILEPDKNVPSTLLLPRNKLCAAMIDHLQRTYSNSSLDSRLQLRFNHRVASIDLTNHRISFANDALKPLSYDLLVGADGIQSVVREAVAADSAIRNTGFKQEILGLDSYYKVIVNEALPSTFNNDAIHYLEFGNNGEASFGLFMIPTAGNKFCILAIWQGNRVPEVLDSNTAPYRVREFMKTLYPMIGELSESFMEQLQMQQPSEVKTVRCNRYHYSSGKVLMLGDAVHCTGGSLGQGANSAFMDVQALDESLEMCNDDLQTFLPLFSARQVKEGLALWKLLQLPPRNPILKPIYSISQLLQGTFANIPPFNQFMPLPIQGLVSTSYLPFSEIVRQNERWISLACNQYPLMRYEPEDVDVESMLMA